MCMCVVCMCVCMHVCVLCVCIQMLIIVNAFICHIHILIYQYADSYCRCVQFTSEIVRINAANGLSLLAAVVVSNMNHHYIHCQGAVISRLQAGLTDDIALNRSKVCTCPSTQ